jgi:hypothetical protein
MCDPEMEKRCDAALQAWPLLDSVTHLAAYGAWEEGLGNTIPSYPRNGVEGKGAYKYHAERLAAFEAWLKIGTENASDASDAKTDARKSAR